MTLPRESFQWPTTYIQVQELRSCRWAPRFRDKRSGFQEIFCFGRQGPECGISSDSTPSGATGGDGPHAGPRLSEPSALGGDLRDSTSDSPHITWGGLELRQKYGLAIVGERALWLDLSGLSDKERGVSGRPRRPQSYVSLYCHSDAPTV